jgi:hypothetical protein
MPVMAGLKHSAQDRLLLGPHRADARKPRLFLPIASGNRKVKEGGNRQRYAWDVGTIFGHEGLPNPIGVPAM